MDESRIDRCFLLVLGMTLLVFIFPGQTFLQVHGAIPAYAQPATEPAAKAKIAFKGGPGDSPATAVVILGAPNSVAGISAEYTYLQQKFGPQNVDWMLARQSVLNQKGKVYDRMDLEMKGGNKKTVFFDISEFFGKL